MESEGMFFRMEFQAQTLRTTCFFLAGCLSRDSASGSLTYACTSLDTIDFVEIHLTLVFFDRRRRKVAKRADLRLGSTGWSSRLDASARDPNAEAFRGEYLAPCRTQGTFSDPEGGDAGHRTPVRNVSLFSSFPFLLFHRLFHRLAWYEASDGVGGKEVWIFVQSPSGEEFAGFFFSSRW